MTHEDERVSAFADLTPSIGEQVLRTAMQMQMDEKYLSDDPATAERARLQFASAHEWLHAWIEEVRTRLIAGEYASEERPAIINMLAELTVLHTAVEHFNLLLLDHGRRLASS